MITYKDKCFCASKVKRHTCGRKISEEDKKRAEKLGFPVAYGFFCGEDKTAFVKNVNNI